jgi:hypothetical protein
VPGFHDGTEVPERRMGIFLYLLKNSDERQLLTKNAQLHFLNQIIALSGLIYLWKTLNRQVKGGREMRGINFNSPAHGL